MGHPHGLLSVHDSALRAWRTAVHEGRTLHHQKPDSTKGDGLFDSLY